MSDETDKTEGTKPPEQPKPTENDLLAEVAKIAAIPPMEYQTQRIEHAQRLGVRVSKLDEWVDAYIHTGGGEGKPFVHSYGGAPSPTETGTSDRPNDRTKEALYELGGPLFEAEDPLQPVRDELRVAGYAGDTSPAESVYLAVSSRHLDRPMNEHLTGPSAVGKNHAADKGLEFHPPEAYYKLSASSARAPVYTEESFQNRFLVFEEMDSIPADGPAASALRALVNNARMIYEVTEQNPKTKKYVNRKIIKEGPTGLITTGTRTLDVQMSTRCLTIPLPDDEDQTRAIMNAEAREAEGTVTDQINYEPFHAYQRWLAVYGEHRVVVPFARALAKLVPAKNVRMRRDFKQSLTGIKTFAFLSQTKRAKKESGEIIATIPEDYTRARKLLAPLLDSLLSDGITPAIRKTVDAIKDDEEISEAALVQRLNMSKNGVAYRVHHAIAGGWLKNTELRKGYPARLSRAAALPDLVTSLPSPERLAEEYASQQTTDDPHRTNDKNSYASSYSGKPLRREGLGGGVYECTNDFRETPLCGYIPSPDGDTDNADSAKTPSVDCKSSDGPHGGTADRSDESAQIHRASAVASNVDLAHAAAILPRWFAAFGEDAQLIHAVIATATTHPELRKALLLAGARRDDPEDIDPQRLGFYLRRIEGVVINGLHLVRDRTRHHTATWRVCPVNAAVQPSDTSNTDDTTVPHPADGDSTDEHDETSQTKKRESLW
jgi:hypothetical protein